MLGKSINTSNEGSTTFGARLRGFRHAAGLSQEDLAFRAGLTAKGIGALERGERKLPYPHTINALAEALELSGEEHRSFVGAAPSRTGMSFSSKGELGEESVSAPPTPLTPLIGRDRELDEVQSLIGENGTRLLTLTGPGGVGKTRLALEVARGAGDWSPEGVAFVGLASVRDPELLVQTIAQSIGLREAGGRPVRDLLHGYLRDRRLLLVLDSLEHLLDAAPEVGALLESCPSLRVLVTSRASLRLRGEREYPVEPLAVPDFPRSPEVGEVGEVDSVRLLVERAREASPSFELTQANAVAVAENCRRLDGLPLALELAATRLKMLSPGALLERLDEALPLLTGGARDLPERQRTMRDTVAWSYELLSSEEQALFRRLSVFSGGWGLSAAEEVGGPSVLEGHSALLENSLIRPEVSPSDGGDAEPRFTMLETLRAYGRERLRESGEEEEVLKRHAEHYLALFERAIPELNGGRQLAWLEYFEAEHDNLRAALSWFIENGEAECVVPMGDGLWMFWGIRGYAAEGQGWMERALASGGGLAGVPRAMALCVILALSVVGGEATRTSEYVDEAIAQAREAGDKEVLGLTMQAGGCAKVLLGDIETAEEYLSEGVAISRELELHLGAHLISVVQGLNFLALAALSRGDLERATEMLNEGESIARGADEMFALGTNLIIQAITTGFQGDDMKTAALLRESIGLSAALGDTWTLPYGMYGMAEIATRTGDPKRAAHLLGASEALGEKTSVVPSFPTTDEQYESIITSIRSQLDPGTLEAAWTRGRTMSLEEIIAEALAE